MNKDELMALLYKEACKPPNEYQEQWIKNMLKEYEWADNNEICGFKKDD